MDWWQELSTEIERNEPRFWLNDARNPYDVIDELNARLAFVHRTVPRFCCRSRGCGHHLAAHTSEGCQGRADVWDQLGGYTVGCKCRSYTEGE